MRPRAITVSSRALGPRLRVRCLIYDKHADMLTAAHRFNGNNLEPDTIGVTQAWTDDQGRAGFVIVRLWRERLTTRVVSHEIHHAATALYGAHVPDRISRRAHLTHYNEPMAHLYSDLLTRLVNRLYELGYYEQAPAGQP